MRLPREWFKVKQILLVVVVAIAAFLLTGFIWGIDALYHGPYATAFNWRCQQLADRAGLVGRPEGEVVQVLGPRRPSGGGGAWKICRPGGPRPEPTLSQPTTTPLARTFRAGSSRSTAPAVSSGILSSSTIDPEDLVGVAW